MKRILYSEKPDITISTFTHEADFLPSIKDGSKKVIDIEEENIPLSDIPDTGDNSNIILALTIFATCGILMAITFFKFHKR